MSMQPRRRWVGLLMTREGEATERSRAQGTQEPRAPDSLLAAEGLPAGRATLPAGVEGGFIRRGQVTAGQAVVQTLTLSTLYSYHQIVLKGNVPLWCLCFLIQK